MNVFISYSSKNRDAADFIAAHLMNRGVDVFIDYESLQVGDNFPERLAREINRCDAVVFLLSEPSAVSRWVRSEIQYAFNKGKLICPVRLDKTAVPEALFFLEGTHMIDFTAWGDAAQGDKAIQRLTKALGIVNPSPTQTPTSPLNPLSLERGDLPAASPPLRTERGLGGEVDRARRFTGTRNRDWQPFVTTFADLNIPTMRFCLVPVGKFQMGSDEYDAGKPAHAQTIAQPYWIAQYPVTNAEWAAAVEAGAVKEPLRVGDSLKWYQDPKMATAPVISVDWLMARDFARWMGCRLPTEREWEYAARGVESWRYPWGNSWNENRAIWSKNSGGKPAPVTSKPEGASWVDARHLSGNVWDRTSSLYQPYPYQPDDGREAEGANRTGVQTVLRGGSWWDGNSISCRADYRNRGFISDRNNVIGLRLALS
jgi:formylglycine-generating enzyme required for sulfatase activity